MLIELLKERNDALQRGNLIAASSLSITLATMIDSVNFIETYNDPGDLLYIKQALISYSIYKKSIPTKELALSEELYDIVFDSIIGNSWNLEKDFIVVDSSLINKERFEKFLQKIGQKRYIFVSGNGISDSETSAVEFDAAEVFQKLGSILPGRIEFLIDKEREESASFEKELRTKIDDLKMSRNTVQRFEGVWLENIMNGIPYYRRSICASSLRQIFFGRHVLIVSPGPSLKNCADVLKKKRSEFILLAVAQAMPALVAMNVTPDFVMVVDPTDYSGVLDGVSLDGVRGLIAYEAVHKNFLAANFIRTFIVSPLSSPIRNFSHLNGQPLDLHGGSVSVQAFSLAVFLGAHVVGLIGQDLCLRDGVQYAVESISGKGLVSDQLLKNEFGDYFLQNRSDGKLRRLCLISGQNGETLLSPPDYCMYKEQIEEFAKYCAKGHKVRLLNFSQGGAQIDGFYNMCLEDYIGDIQFFNDPIFPNVDGYLNSLSSLVDDCIRINERFSKSYKELFPDDDLLVANFLDIPLIRHFGIANLIDFFIGFDVSLTTEGASENYEKLQDLMKETLVAHMSFFTALRDKIQSL